MIDKAIERSVIPSAVVERQVAVTPSTYDPICTFEAVLGIIFTKSCIFIVLGLLAGIPEGNPIRIGTCILKIAPIFTFQIRDCCRRRLWEWWWPASTPRGQGVHIRVGGACVCRVERVRIASILTATVTTVVAVVVAEVTAMEVEAKEKEAGVWAAREG